MRILTTLMLTVLVGLSAIAQTLNVVPKMQPESGTYDDKVVVECSFPEGCAGGKYWINGGEFSAKTYDGPIALEYDCSVSCAGVNEAGRIITDVVTKEYTINRVTPPTYVVSPKEGIRKESFYVTKLTWEHVGRVDLDTKAYNESGSLYGQKLVWITNEAGATIASSGGNGLWMDGLNSYKAYIYKNYDIQTLGKYQLHIAKNVFTIDGVLYDKEIVLNYEVSNGNTSPEFSPAEGEYYGPLTVIINYPEDGSAFYKFYKINGAKAKQYSDPLVINETSTIEAYGMDEGFSAYTPTVKATYTIKTKDPEPEKLPTPTIHRSGNTITISGPEGATLKYWLNDKMSTAAIYTAPFEVTENGRVSCVAYNDVSKSNTANYTITGFNVDRGDLGEQVLITPVALETMHMRAISPNGRYAAGFLGSDTSSSGLIWNLASDKQEYQSTIYINQLWGVSNDGTAYGWRTRTQEVSEDMTDADLLWGICKNGIWTEKPAGMVTENITADGKLFGSKSGRPALYDFATESYTYYNITGAQSGHITAMSDDNTVAGGYVIVDGQRVPAIWQGTDNITILSDAIGCHNPGITDISGNGKWAIVGQDFRLNVATGDMEHMISMTSRYHNTTNPEVLTAIADDGTIFGAYDGSLMGTGYGTPLVYTIDGRWRSFSDWLRDEKDLTISGYYVTSIAAVANGHDTFLFHGMRLLDISEDAFTRGIVLNINTQVKHLAPVALKAEHMNGMNVIKLSWDKPLNEAYKVSKYIVRRNGTELATTDNNTFAYYDNTVESDVEYTYTISAKYNDGVESNETEEVKISFSLKLETPIHDLNLYRIGLNDVKLTWQQPVTAMPKLQYFDEAAEAFAFGTAGWDSEWGIRIPASDLKIYEGQVIRLFQFLPVLRQNGYTLNLYHGDNTKDGAYDAEPFYTQEIDPSTLNYGSVNTIALTTPQALDTSRDLYIALLINNTGNDGMLGVSYEGFKAGYTDLCRVVGAPGFDTMMPMSKVSSTKTELVLPLGVVVASDATSDAVMLNNYIVKDNGEVVGTSNIPQIRIDNVSDGTHVFDVIAAYNNGKSSEPVSVSLDMQKNENAYIPVDDVNITVNDDNTVTLKWEAPLDEDRSYIHYGDMTPSWAWDIARGIDAFTAISSYSADLTAAYADDYEIVGMYYYPMADVSFALSIEDDFGAELAYVVPDDVVFNEINIVPLETPLTVDGGKTYLLKVDVSDAYSGCRALAFDSTNKWRNGMSNLIDYGYGMTTIAEFLQVGETPNWLMGLVVRQKNAKPLPLEGYDVRIDGTIVNSSAVTATSYTTEAIAKGNHTANVDVIYTSAVTKQGADNDFRVSKEIDGILDINADGTDNALVYDLQGRRVIRNAAGQGLYIVSGKIKAVK